MLFLYGVGKIAAGPAGFVRAMEQAFAETWMPALAVRAFSWALPFTEVLLGAVLVVGPWTTPALLGAGLLLVALMAGTVIVQDTAAVAQNVVYVAVIAVVLAVAGDDVLSVDGWRRRQRDI